MKLKLLLSAAFVLLSAVSGAHSKPSSQQPQRDSLAINSEDSAWYNDPSSENAPAIAKEEVMDGGTKPTSIRLGSGGSERRRGESAGTSEANRIWKRLGNKCANAIGGEFERAIDKRTRAKGWHRDEGNWRTRAFNRGARDGMQKVVMKYKKQCLHDNPSECIDLGNEAAFDIVDKFCPTSHSRRNRNARKYEKNCRRQAITHCKGNIFNLIQGVQGCKQPNDRGLTRLQNSCDRVVDKHINVQGMTKDSFDFDGSDFKLEFETMEE